MGDWHKVSVEQIKVGAVIARHRGEEGQIEMRHLFQRLSLLLMRGNASLLVNCVLPKMRLIQLWRALSNWLNEYITVTTV